MENYTNGFLNGPPFIKICVALPTFMCIGFGVWGRVRFSIKLGNFVFGRFSLGLESWQEQAWPPVYVTSGIAVVAHLLARKSSAFSPESPAEDYVTFSVSNQTTTTTTTPHVVTMA